MKIINGIGIVLSGVMGFVTWYYMRQVDEAIWGKFITEFDYTHQTGYYGASASSLTIEAGMYCIIFLAYFTYAFILNLMRSKSSTLKWTSIGGLVVTGLSIVLTVFTFTHPVFYSFSKVGDVFFAVAAIQAILFTLLLSNNLSNPTKQVNLF